MILRVLALALLSVGAAADTERVLPNAGQFDFDYSMVNGPHRSPNFPAPVRQYPGAIGLVTLRRDGFVSLDAGDQPGTLLTKPFVLPAGALHVNAGASGGSLCVAVCDEAGAPIRGFEASRAITTDAKDAVVSWEKAKLERLQGRAVRLRFTLTRGKLFSYWIARARE